MATLLMKQAIGELVRSKRMMIDIPSTHTVGQALDLFLRFDILSAPVWAPPGSFLGAGGSMIIEEHQGKATKQYIGMVSVLDILIHFGEQATSKEKLLQSSVVHLIGHSNETLSLWTMSSETQLYDVMEPLSKGVHRMLVPLEDHSSSHHGVEIDDKSSKFRLLTQTDVVQFLAKHAMQLGNLPQQSVEEAGFLHRSVLAVPSNLSVLHAVQVIRRNAGVLAIALVEPDTFAIHRAGETGTASGQVGGAAAPLWGSGGRLVGTFSASDLRRCDAHMLHSFPSMAVSELLAQASPMGVPKAPISCRPSATVLSVMEAALGSHVHRVWVTDDNGWLSGVVTFSDIIGAFRKTAPSPAGG